MITAIGAILVPLCLLFYNRPWKLLALVFYYSVFAAAALVAVGGAGVTPGLLPASLFTLTFFAAMFRGVRYPAERRVLILLTPFMLVVVGALLSSIIMPRLFFNEVFVWPQKMTLDVHAALAPNSGNYTQDMYLLSDALLTVTAAIYLTRPEAKLNRLFDCFLTASFIVDAIAMWQFIGNTVHVWYPTDFFLSNPGWSQLSGETVGSMVRLNGPFSEPSSLAAYLSASVCGASWLLLEGDKRWMPRLVFGLGLGIVMLSTATTGFVTLAIMGGFLVFRVFVGSSARFRRRVLIGGFAALVLGVLAGAITPIVAPGIANEASLIVSSTMNKNQSASYRDRTAADRDSVADMLQTSGLGVGWGSNRSSSLLPGLCAAIGVWGLAGLFWFGCALVFRLRRVAGATQDAGHRRVIGGIGVAVLSTLVSGVISEPTISSPDFFLLLGMLIAAAAGNPQLALSQIKPERPANFDYAWKQRAPDVSRG